ncbi:ribokinase [Domibacillus sp. 8LH]|uniref:ribokinase n=1 Tax=Domibacillus sp. 8LH TaxID=3073900 RepID=UPI00317DA92C
MENKSVAVIGSLNYDIIFKQKKFPEIGETYMADSVTFCSGGKGANQAVQCSKLGLKTYMVGKIGDDNHGEMLLKSLQKYNVDTTFITTSNTNTGLGVVNSLEDGSVVATISTGANYALTVEDIKNAEDVIAKSSIVILQLEIPLEVVEYSIKMAKKHNCFIILNAAPSNEISEECIKLVNCLVVNESEASFFAGEKIENLGDAMKYCKKIYNKISDVLVITLGKQGSLIYDGEQKYFIEPHKVEAIETTGAGDSYIGALAYGILNKMTYQQAGSFASKVSSMTVMKIGSQEAMPTLSTIKQLQN